MIDSRLQATLESQGISRRAFLKFCVYLTSMLGMPPGMAATMADNLLRARRPSVIWLSFQECTGCTESITRSHQPTLESLILNALSLDYHHTLQAASGEAAEAARKTAMVENKGRYIVVVDGSIPLGAGGGYSTIAGMSNLDMLLETARDAAALIAVGTCAAYGGLPMARPNPTGAVAVTEIIKDKPIINVPGCPPVPTVMTGVIAQWLATRKLPELDAQRRPKAFFGGTVHDRCYRKPFYDQRRFARSFDDLGARSGWCLFELGCKGPVTHNVCSTAKWNGGVSFPVESGHPCIGCSEPGFWDMGGLYSKIEAPARRQPASSGSPASKASR